jgi:Zn finger protein HypA/HybF involved in hydrogenase expression
MAKEYVSQSGERLFKPVIGEDIQEPDFDDGTGWCLACAELAEGVEPDARKYTCEACGKAKVYGLAELALMGLVATAS